jgi:hypothetical protein
MNTTEQLKDLLYTNRILLANGLAALIREDQHAIDSNPGGAWNESTKALEGYIKSNRALLDQIGELVVADDTANLEK